MAAPIPNGTIPIMAGGVPQPVAYPQQSAVVVAAAGAAAPALHGSNAGQLHYNNGANRRNPGDEQCKIFVGGVGKNTTEGSLRAYFGKFGEIADSVIMQDRETGEPRGFAFVTFKSPDAVNAVIEQCNSGGHTLDGKVIDPKPAVPQGPSQQTKLTQMKQQQMQTQGPMYKGPMQVSEELKIFVGGIGIGTTEEDVKNYFQTFGEVVAVDMPYHKIYNCPKGFAFVGFTDIDVVRSITKDRYHQINGKTVEVKDAEEQQAHIRKKRAEGYRTSNSHIQRHPTVPGTISTIGGVGAYANIAAAGGQQVLIPQVIGGQTQYVAAQIPQAAAQPQYVFDPATNTYYQLPAANPILAGGAGAAAYSPYGGVQLMANPAVAAAAAVAGSPIAAPQVQAGGDATGVIAALSGAEGQLGAIYSNETSTFGPSRTHVLGAGHQPIAGGTTDPQVVYSNAAALSAGETVPSRGFHPYGR